MPAASHVPVVPIVAIVAVAFALGAASPDSAGGGIHGTERGREAAEGKDLPPPLWLTHADARVEPRSAEPPFAPPPLPVNSSSAATPRYGTLAALRFTNENAAASFEARLYADDGTIDAREAERIDVGLADARKPGERHVATLDRRLLQLVFRAAYHFGVKDVDVVSAYRKPGRFGEGLHARARAIDFRLEGVAADRLAAYLRELPRVGVGLYTHPRTKFVHLDVRERSYHWIDASAPHQRWREWGLSQLGLGERDAAYDPKADRPENVE